MFAKPDGVALRAKHDAVESVGNDHQRQVVADLAAWFAADPEGRLDADLRSDLAAAPDDAARLRVVVDQVAGLTDVRALALHAQHCH